MNRRYEALLVLNAQGKEDTVREIIDRLESEFQKEGAQIEQVQKMDKRQFSYVAGPLDSGYYVNLFLLPIQESSRSYKRNLNSTRKCIVRITNACPRRRKRP